MCLRCTESPFQLPFCSEFDDKHHVLAKGIFFLLNFCEIGKHHHHFTLGKQRWY